MNAITTILAKYILTDGYFKLKKAEETLEMLKSLLMNLRIKIDNEKLSEGLSYFRECYYVRPFIYPGDYIYYEMLMNYLKKGLSLENCFIISKLIIDREISMKQQSAALGLNYTENWKI